MYLRSQLTVERTCVEAFSLVLYEEYVAILVHVLNEVEGQILEHDLISAFADALHRFWGFILYKEVWKSRHLGFGVEIGSKWSSRLVVKMLSSTRTLVEVELLICCVGLGFMAYYWHVCKLQYRLNNPDLLI
jgi:hypothetical protein